MPSWPSLGDTDKMVNPAHVIVMFFFGGRMERVVYIV